VKVKVWEQYGNLILQIEDNGIGMTPSQLSVFQYIVNDPVEQDANDDRENRMHLERRGLGIRSVADRIRIEYGHRYGIFICSSLGYGTIIQCVIPKYDQGEDHNAKSIIG